MLAVIFRIIGPIVRQTIVFHKPFIHVGNNFIQSSINDEWYYNLTAKSLMEKRIYGLNIQDPGAGEIIKEFPKYFNESRGVYKHKIVPPLYPIFLAVLYSVFGINTFAYLIPQIILSAFTCILIYFIAEKLFNQQVAALSASIVAFYPDLIFWTYTARVETLFIFLITLLFLILLQKDILGRILNAFFVGILWGLISLTRLTFIFFVPFIILWIFLTWRTEKKMIIAWLLMASFSFVLILLPWAIRNLIVFNNFTVMTDEVGAIIISFATSTPHPYYMIASDHITQTSYVALLLKYIWHDPFGFIFSACLRTLKYLGPFTEPMNEMAKLYKSITWLIVFPASFFGIYSSIRRQWLSLGLLITFIIYYTLIHSLSYVDDGLVYRYPIQPFLAIFSAYGFWFIYHTIRNIHSSKKHDDS